MMKRTVIEPNLEDLQVKVERLPHIMGANANWYEALNRALDLLETPNNLDALWVWSRFLNAFGRLDTWAANHCLDKLAYFEGLRRRHQKELDSVPRYRWLKRRRLAWVVGYDARNVQIVLDHILTNLSNWLDREAFEAHKGKTG